MTASGSSRSPGDLVRELTAALERQDWDGLRRLYHPDARLVTVAGGPEPKGPDETLEIIRAAASHPLYRAQVWEGSCRVLDSSACLLQGSLRHGTPEGGFGERTTVWLYTLRDGLLYRSRYFSQESDAIAAYQESGLSLGA
jgi:ketosteroid isomerase-like protein